LPNAKNRSRRTKAALTKTLRESKEEFVTFELMGKFADMADSRGDINLLLNLLEKHPDSIVRHEAAAQLAANWKKRPGVFETYGHRIICGLLKTAMDDRSVVARHEAIESLGYLGDESILSDLERLIHDDNEDIRRTAKIAVDVVKYRKKNRVSFSRLWIPMLKGSLRS
jgi:HEAT repeat protein